MLICCVYGDSIQAEVVFLCLVVAYQHAVYNTVNVYIYIYIYIYIHTHLLVVFLIMNHQSVVMNHLKFSSNLIAPLTINFFWPVNFFILRSSSRY